MTGSGCVWMSIPFREMSHNILKIRNFCGAKMAVRVFPIQHKVCDTPPQFEQPTRRTIETMTFARILFASLILGFFGFVSAQSKPGLTFNGQLMIVPKGVEFSYEPGNRRVVIRTFFGDLRCSPGDQGSTGQLTVNIDRLGTGESEVEASYKVFSDGLVQYDPDPGNRMVSIETSGGGAPDCQHKFPVVETDPVTGEVIRDTFWVSDFSGPINITSNSTGTLAVGGRASITFTLINDSGVVVATGFGADLVSLPSDLPILDANITECQPSDVPATINPDTFAVSIPVLWPGESCTIEVAYDLTNVLAGEIIETTLSGLNAMNRSGTAQLELGMAEFTVVNTTTAP